jgi:hypothetical protein
MCLSTPLYWRILLSIDSVNLLSSNQCICFAFRLSCFLLSYVSQGCATAQAVSRRLPIAAVRVRSQIKSCGICGRKIGIGEGSFRVFLFPYSSSGAGTIGQLMADIPSGLSLTPHQETKIYVGVYYRIVGWL